MNEEIIRMEAEIDSINIRIDRSWEAIKVDLARKEWLRIQILKVQGMKI